MTTPRLTILSPNDVKEHSGLIMVFGFILIVVGLLAIGSPFVAGSATALWVGAGILVSGAVQIIGALKGQGSRSVAMGFLGGILSLVAGGILLSHPVISLAIFTLLLAGYFVADGIGKMILAVKMKPEAGWGLLLFAGVLNLLFGGMIWRQWPLSGTWAIGTLVGINILFTGWSMISLGLAAKSDRLR